MPTTFVFVIDSLGDGGAEKVVLTLAKALYIKGNRVHLITIKNHVVYPIPDGVIYHTMKFKKGLGFYRMLTDFCLQKKLAEKIMDIHRHSPVKAVFSHLVFSDTLLSREKFEFPVFFTIHNTYSQQFLENRKWLRKKIKLKKLQRTYNNRHLIAVSKGVQHDLVTKVGICPASIRTVYNPFDFEQIRQMADLPLNSNLQNYILHAGRFSPQKRHDILLKAFAKSGIDCPLVLLGTATESDKNKIKEMAASMDILDRLVIQGFTDNPYNWMKNARLCVLSSDYEGFALVIVESLIAGTPVISTDCPYGPSEILENYPQLLSPVGDVDSLAYNIVKYYTTPPEIDETLLDKFSIKNITGQLETIAEQVSQIVQFL